MTRPLTTPDPEARMTLPHFPGWHLLGAFPDGEPDDVGSWLLAHRGEALLLEVPPGLTFARVRAGLDETRAVLRSATASRDHEDHLDGRAWDSLVGECDRARFVHPSAVKGDRLLRLGGEPLWLVKAPKHSPTDV